MPRGPLTMRHVVDGRNAALQGESDAKSQVMAKLKVRLDLGFGPRLAFTCPSSSFPPTGSDSFTDEHSRTGCDERFAQRKHDPSWILATAPGALFQSDFKPQRIDTP